MRVRTTLVVLCRRRRCDHAGPDRGSRGGADEPARAVPAARPPAAPAVPRTPFSRDRYRIAHKQFTLDNGLRLIVHEDHSAPIVAVNLWYHVGSRNEQRGKTGFAHLFEHFFFNGSEHHPSGFREAMDDLGANNRNGTTNGDRTNFFENVPVVRRSSARSSSRPIAWGSSPRRSPRRASSASAAWCRTRSARARTSRTRRPSRG